jgi:uncharacterized Rossmann fold enzyme/SAM-dependent methyltransferase
MDIEILCNTPDAAIFANIAASAARALPWVAEVPAHEGHAVLVGGGPSLVEQLPQIRKRYELGQTVFALNGAAKFLNGHGIKPHYQVLLDARPESVGLLHEADEYLVCSQCDGTAFEALEGKRVRVWHPAIDDVTRHLPEYDGEYALVGGGLTVGLSSMCLAYIMGYRKLHLFGYDSSHRQTLGHAYAQPMNDSDILCKVTLGGKVFTSSLTMARQAEVFPEVCDNLNDLGCIITVDGDGLIRAVVDQMAVNAAPKTEAQKYAAMWSFPEYRNTSPGEQVADTAVQVCGITAKHSVIDFGCGTGRGGKAIADKTGAAVLLVDFADNCRDEAAQALPFQLADLTQRMGLSADLGFCTDVMEHIPPEAVRTVITNVMACVDGCFFQISLVPDNMGVLIGQPLHLSVFPVSWWLEQFAPYEVVWQWANDENAMFYLRNLE